MKYLCDPHVIPTNTCPSDLSELEARSHGFAAFAGVVQIDIADGVFAPVTSWPYRYNQTQELESRAHERAPLPYADTVQYEAHLMVADPVRIGELLALVGVSRLVPHVEAFADPDSVRSAFLRWKDAGAREIGLAILIDTPLDALDPFVADCDVVQIMSIAKIGAQGQSFDERALQRVEELHAKYPDTMVAVDGGVSEKNIEMLVRAGANRLCVGSAISQSPDPARSYAAILERALKGCAPIRTELAI